MANDENVQPVKLKPGLVESANIGPRRGKPSEAPSSQRLMGLIAYLLALLLLALGGLVYLLLLAISHLHPQKFSVPSLSLAPAP